MSNLLPARGTSHSSRNLPERVALAAAVEDGALTMEQAEADYDVTSAELAVWQRAFATFGLRDKKVRGLRANLEDPDLLR